MTLLRETTQTARKIYFCDACHFLREQICDDEFTISELRHIVRAKRNKWRIMPGEKYIKQVQVDTDGLHVFRAIPEIHDICLNRDFYEE